MVTEVLKALTDKPPAEICMLGLPFDQYSSFLRGSASGPAALREALYCESTSLWTENGKDLASGRIFRDAGDLDFPPDLDPFDRIEQTAAAILATSAKPVFIGGDHSVTFPIIKALGRVETRLTILHLDAHPDLWDELGGNRRSHACPFARIMEQGLAARLVQVGVRNINGHQRQQAERFGVEMFEMKDWTGDLDLKLDGPVYVSFDLDVLDPAFAPGVSHYEPGGLTTREALKLIHRLKAPIVGADVVELNPKLDRFGVTAAAAAKIVKEIGGKILDCSARPD